MKRWLYTGITRAKEKVFIITPWFLISLLQNGHEKFYDS
jgi:ATP-dependent exoDNAse (exonuclease V) alpha subunit